MNIVELRVRYSEVDGMRRAYNAHYLTWFEIGRTELFRYLGINYSDIEKEKNLYLPVREVYAKYKKPLFYDDIINIHTHCKIIDKKRVRFDYKIMKKDQICATGFSVHVFIDSNGVLQNIPDFFKESLKVEK